MTEPPATAGPAGAGSGLTVLAFSPEGYQPVEDVAAISGVIAAGSVVWADLCGPDEADLGPLRDELGLHPLAIEDAFEHGQRPKLEQFDSHAFVVAYAADAGTGELVELDLFVGERWLVTVHERAARGGRFDILDTRQRVCRMKPAHPTSAFLLYLVLDAVVDSYFSLLDQLGDEVDRLEERIFADPDPERDEAEVQRDMLGLRKRLLGFRRKVVPLREVLLALMRDDVPWMTADARQYLQDVFDHVMRVSDEIDSRRELINNAVDAHLALASNHMNRTMKRMTSWGAILIVATLIAGIYGMNFDEMPELHWAYGYPFAVGLMVVATVVLYAYFKRRDWL